MVHAGAIVNMRIGPIYIRKHDRGNNAISRHKGVKARKEGGTEVRQIVVISSRNQLIGLGNRRDDIKKESKVGVLVVLLRHSLSNSTAQTVCELVV